MPKKTKKFKKSDYCGPVAMDCTPRNSIVKTEFTQTGITRKKWENYGPIPFVSLTFYKEWRDQNPTVEIVREEVTSFSVEVFYVG